MAAVEFLPAGRSYLNLRFDAADGHTIKSIALGEKIIDVSAEKILPLRKDDNLKDLRSNMEKENENEQ